MKRNMRNWMYEIINSTDRKAMPVLSFPGAELAGISIEDTVKSGEAQFRCIKAIADKYPGIANVTCMDLSVEAEAFGCRIHFSDNEVPTVTRGIINDISEALNVKLPAVGDKRTSEYIHATQLAVRNIPGTPTFAGMIGPFSLAGRLYDMTEMMISTMTDEDDSLILLQKCTDFLIEYAKAFRLAGANGLIIAEPAAGLLSPDKCHEFSSVFVKQIVDTVQDEHFMVILHNCGNTKNQITSLLSTGAMGFHFGNAVKMEEIMPMIPWGRIAIGNIDPAGIIKNSDPETVAEKTMEVLIKTATYKNFVLSSGCDIPPGTPHENIESFYSQLDEFNEFALTGEIA